MDERASAAGLRRSKPPVRVSWTRRLLRPLPIIVIVAVLGYCGWFSFGSGGLYESYKLERRKNAHSEEISRLEQRKQRLAEYLAALRSGNDLAMERAARERGLVASNEVIYDIRVAPQPEK